MKIVKLQEKELNEARELQQKCLDLHLPVPPVVLWDATIIDKDGNEKERTIAKANSYVRNALNLLARYVGMASTSNLSTSAFKNGLINLKTTLGTIENATIGGSPNLYFNISLGDRPTPPAETLDHFEDWTNTGNWSVAGQLHYSNFDESTNKFITQFIVVYVNTNSTTTQYISEAGVFLNNLNTSLKYLMLRDIFTPIAVGAGESIRFVYQTEVLFPQ